eukprot:TRINITY_DN34790_c0_g1_i1.p1 TRINITY_DN34790_c0_g1~~TRINITY_DN34790_c0_g1_i1.p1  ORF type:complete len:179 (-),score=50.41 TRINITY_DN34790_c0_g1_i1:38-574(-)
MNFFFFQAEDGIRDVERSRGLGDVYKRQVSTQSTWGFKDIGSNFKDPIGVSGEKDEESVAEEFEVKSGTFRKMESLFGSKSAAYAYLLFILIYLPCVAVIATIYRETNLKWTIFVASYLTILAWIVSSIFFQTANFFAHPLSSFLWIISLLVVVVVFYFILKKKKKKKNKRIYCNWTK